MSSLFAIITGVFLVLGLHFEGPLPGGPPGIPQGEVRGAGHP